MDPISSMLIMIKNASIAGHETVTVPFSKLKQAIADCLVKEGFLKGASKRTLTGAHESLELTLAYKEDKQPKVQQVKRISKSSQRVYLKNKEIRPIRNGSGLLVLSTPKGILSGKDARKELVGGEPIFSIW